jgi:hypothetical protein
VLFWVGLFFFYFFVVMPFYLVGSVAVAPKLPTGYFWAIAIVLLPPWWRRAINPKLKPAS